LLPYPRQLPFYFPANPYDPSARNILYAVIFVSMTHTHYSTACLKRKVGWIITRVSNANKFPSVFNNTQKRNISRLFWTNIKLQSINRLIVWLGSDYADLIANSFLPVVVETIKSHVSRTLQSFYVKKIITRIHIDCAIISRYCSEHGPSSVVFSMQHYWSPPPLHARTKNGKNPVKRYKRVHKLTCNNVSHCYYLRGTDRVAGPTKE